MGNTQRKLRHFHHENYKEEEDEEDEDVSSFTCEICIEPVYPNKKFKNKNSCSHPFCSDCIVKYIQVKVEDNISEVKCPDLNCEKLLDALSCRSILPVRVFEKWCDVLCESAILRCKRVYCPIPDCSVLILNECGGSVRRSTCPNCKKLFCFQCKVPWHAGYPCNEAGVMRDRNGILFGQLVETKRWTRCPTCNNCVELVSGCSRVRCRCGTLFCHSCGRKISYNWCWCKSNMRTNLTIVCMMILLSAFFLLLITMAFKIFHFKKDMI